MIAERFEREARARIVWGDSHEDVIAHLKTQGATEQEAQRAFEAVKDCRVEYVRGAAKEGMFIGIGLLLVPVIGLAIFAFLPVKVCMDPRPCRVFDVLSNRMSSAPITPRVFPHCAKRRRETIRNVSVLQC